MGFLWRRPRRFPLLTLDQINRGNVARLTKAWEYHTGELDRHPDRKAFASFHATPLILPGAAGRSLVFCTPFNRIIALDPATGQVAWHYPLVQLTKMGLIFAFHRDTGVPGEQLSPTQPSPTTIPPLVKGGLTPEDAWGYTFMDRLVVPINRAPTCTRLLPLAQVPAVELAQPMAGLMGNPGRLNGTPYAQVFKPLLSPLFSPCNAPPWGELAAGSHMWQYSFKIGDALIAWNLPE